MMFGKAVALLLVSVGQLPAPPVQPQSGMVEVSGDRIVARGVIDSRMVAAIVAAGTAREIRSLSITSPGGDALSGLAIGELVRDQSWSVDVPELCASACAVYVLPAAARVDIAANAVVVLHWFPSAETRDEAIGRTRRKWGRSQWIERSVARWQAQHARLLPEQDRFFARLHISQAPFVTVARIWRRINVDLRKKGLISENEAVDIAVDRHFLRECLGLSDVTAPDYTVEDSITNSRMNGMHLAFAAGDEIYYEGQRIDRITCGR